MCVCIYGVYKDITRIACVVDVHKHERRTRAPRETMPTFRAKQSQIKCDATRRARACGREMCDGYDADADWI